MMGLPLHRLLFLFAPETAHRLAVSALRLLQAVWCRALRQRITAAPAIRVDGFAGLTFPSRVGLAAGFDKNGEMFAGLALLGFGFIEVGTVTPRPQEGNPRPRLWRRSPRALVNHLGFNNCGLEEFAANLRRYRPWVRGVPLFANIGKNKDTANDRALEDYRQGFEKLAPLVDGFVVNLSSPNTPGLRSLQSAEFLESLAGILPRKLPVLVKLAPDLDDAEMTALCGRLNDDSRFTGVVLTNTSRALAAQAGFDVGGLSGEPLAERALACVSLARATLRPGKVVIGVGGIVTADHARRMRKAGADLVELYTGFVYGGPALLRQVRRALED